MDLIDASKDAHFCHQIKTSTKRTRRIKNRRFYCSIHKEQLIEGTGKKYFLHLLTPEELCERGFPNKKARLIINAYPVYVLSTEWLEQLYCPKCSANRWYHITKDDPYSFSIRLAKRDLWKQVAHVDPASSNPSVSQYSLRQASRHRRKRTDNKDYFD